MAELSSYCTHTSLRGCRCAFLWLWPLAYFYWNCDVFHLIAPCGCVQLPQTSRSLLHVYNQDIHSLSLNLSLSLLPSLSAHLPLTKFPYFTFNTYYLYLLNHLTLPLLLSFNKLSRTRKFWQLPSSKTLKCEYFLFYFFNFLSSNFTSPRGVYQNPNTFDLHYSSNTVDIWRIVSDS